MDFNKEEFQARFVANGGSPEVAKSIADKSTPPAAASTALAAAVAQTLANDLFPADVAAASANAAPPPKTSDHRVLNSKFSSVVRRGRKPAELHAQPHTQQELDLFQLSMEIDSKNAVESGDLGFMATSMIYAALPHSEIKSGFFKRTNGPISLSIMNDPDIGLPYGKIPRIITAFLCTEAKRYAAKNGRDIFLGNSQAEFMSKLGMYNTGGQRGDIARTHDQALRLFTSTIQLKGEPGNNELHWKKVDISPDGMILWNPQTPNEKTKWTSKLRLGESFFEECINHSVPLDLRVIRDLRSPLAIDIYIWLTYRYNSIKYATPITWKQLKWQFGANYADTNQGLSDFKTNFKKQLRNVLAVYRDAKIDVQQDVVIMLPSPPHILRVPTYA
jgi:hypothetical protein